MNHTLTNVIIPFHSSYDGKNINKDIPAIIHHGNKNGVVIINYPGANGHIDGYENKYEKLANFLTGKNLGTVIRLGNHPIPGIDWETSTQEVLQHTIDHALENSVELAGTNTPTIYLMGASAGASAIAAVCSLYDEVKKVLLIAPSADAGWEAMENGLFNYTNELYITAGEDDIFIGMHIAPLCHKVAVNAAKVELITIPNCDHQFRGQENGKIFSKAPLWAFSEDITYPSSDGGVVLYD
jgi:hypothetical protein